MMQGNARMAGCLARPIGSFDGSMRYHVRIQIFIDMPCHAIQPVPAFLGKAARLVLIVNLS